MRSKWFAVVLALCVIAPSTASAIGPMPTSLRGWMMRLFYQDKDHRQNSGSGTTYTGSSDQLCCFVPVPRPPPRPDLGGGTRRSGIFGFNRHIRK